MLGSVLCLHFDLLHAATNNRYADGYNIQQVNEAPIALFSSYKLALSSGKHIEENNHAHIVCLMYELITSARNTDDLSIGFDRSRDVRQKE